MPDLQSGGCRFESRPGLLRTKVPPMPGVAKWVPAIAGKAKAGMAHSDCGWTCGYNTCHSWARLWWCMHYAPLPLTLPLPNEYWRPTVTGHVRRLNFGFSQTFAFLTKYARSCSLAKRKKSHSAFNPGVMCISANSKCVHSSLMYSQLSTTSFRFLVNVG